MPDLDVPSLFVLDESSNLGQWRGGRSVTQTRIDDWSFCAASEIAARGASDAAVRRAVEAAECR